MKAPAALVLSAFVWGLSWWPYRALDARGLHPLWATAFVFASAAVAVTLARPRAWRELATRPALWAIAAANGVSIAGFNWAVTIGDVVRVVLMFYLMPLWTLLLARWLLGEALSWGAGLRIALALVGAAIVLHPPAGGWPLPSTLAEGLGLVAGIAFALCNVLIRRDPEASQSARSLAMLAGSAAVGLVLALALTEAAPPAAAAGWILGTLALGAAFLIGNLAFQYGAARLPAGVTAVVMLVEVLFASGSAALLGAGEISAPLLMGGALIVGAALLSV